MRIGGFQKLSLIDYPGKVAAIVFTQGCNFRCGYCHNPELVLPSLYQKPIDENVVLEFLRSRQGRLEGVVVTGGEPTLQPDLGIFLSKLKSLRYAVKLDTNGSRPDILKALIKHNLIDYIAMDIKAPLEKYGAVTGVAAPIARIQESLGIIKTSGIAHHFRTILLKSIGNKEDVEQVLALAGGSRHIGQPFNRSRKLVDKSIL